MDPDHLDVAAGELLEASAAEIRDYLAAMALELAGLAAKIGRTDIEAKLREAAGAALLPN